MKEIHSQRNVACRSLIRMNLFMQSRMKELQSCIFVAVMVSNDKYGLYDEIRKQHDA